MRLRLIIGLLLAPCASATAQVGYLPSQSPFHELTKSAFIEVTGGQVFGGGGLLNLGPRNGGSEGLRIVIRSNHTLQFSFGMWTAGTERSWIDAFDSVATRNKGLVNSRLIAGEFGVQFNATGGKTWHGLAPYVGLGVGFVQWGGISAHRHVRLRVRDQSIFRPGAWRQSLSHPGRVSQARRAGALLESPVSELLFGRACPATGNGGKPECSQHDWCNVTVHPDT